MNRNRYKRLEFKILKELKNNEYNENFDYYSIEKYCKDKLDMSSNELEFILSKLKESNLIEGGFKCNKGLKGNTVFSIDNRLQPKLTKEGKEKLSSSTLTGILKNGIKQLLELKKAL